MPAQSVFASITGTVTDGTGAVVPGVTVTAIHLGTDLRSSTTTNELGVYTLGNLREGDFRVEAKAAGFQDVTIPRVSLLVRGIRRVDLVLQVGDVHQTVEVTAAAGLIETDTGKISDVRSGRELTSLGNNAVSRSVEGYWPITATFAVVGGAPSFAGSRSDQWHASYDGASISNGMGGTTGGNIMDYNDWVKETKIDYANNSAEFGQVVQIALVSKSGENDFHGSATEYYSSTGFNARNPFASSRSSGKTSIPGFSAGGPLYIPKLYNGKNKTFWFVSAENVRAGGFGVNGYLNATVPLASWRNGDFGVPIRNPFNGDVYTDGRIPQQFINPVAKAIQDRFYPLPNYGDPNALQSLNFRQTMSPPLAPQYNASIRLDQKLGDKDYIFGSFMLDQLRVGVYEGNLPSFGHRRQIREQKVVNVTHSHTFRPTLLNEFRFGHGADTNKYQGPLDGQQVVNTLGLKGLAPGLPDIGGVYNLGFSGVGLTGLSQISYGLYGPRTQHLQDQVSYFRGRHAFKFGTQVSRVFPTEVSASSCLFGCATFANTYTKVPGIANSGNPYADFLFGVPTNATRSFPPLTVQRRRWLEDFYVTDDWKITQRLTLNLGLRYELHPAWSEASGMLAVFNPATGNIAVPDNSLSQVSALMPTSYVQVVKASSLGLPSTLIHTDTNNLAPRFGIAYRPFGNNTVFRGGYGIYYDATPPMPIMAGIPYSISEPTYTNTTPAPALVLPQAFPSTGSKGPATVGLPAAVNPDLKIPYTQQWNLTVEHEHFGFGFRASYVGTFTRQMTFNRDINAPVVDSRPYIQKARPFPNYPGISYLSNGASHNYNGATFAVQRRMKNGLLMEANLTWARDIGDAVGLENPYDRRRERGPELSIPRLRWTDTFMYELPFGRGHKWLSHASRAANALVGGWQISAITYMQTGQYLTPTMTIPDPAGISYTGGNAPLVTIRPDVLRNPNISNPTLGHWFDTSAFVAPAPGHFGNSGRGLVVGPGDNVWHAAVQKYITFSEDPRVPRIRLDLYATNVFNHPNWSNPNVNLSNPNVAGAITSVGGPNGGSYGDSAGARTARMAIRVEW